MNIQDWREKIKRFLICSGNLKERLTQGETASRYYTAAIIVLVGLSSFGLGRLSALDEQRGPIVIEENDAMKESPAPTAAVGAPQSASIASSVKGQLSNVKGAASPESGGKIVASKTGTKYYFVWCSNNIAEKNKVWFNSEAEARAKGLQPAANCKGLK